MIFPDKLLTRKDHENKEVQIVFSTSGAKDKVSKTISASPVEKSNISITTIHSVKGKTCNAVMVVSAPSKKGDSKDNHWEYWIDKDNYPEAARLAYVASSRAEYLLVWAVKKGTDRDVERLAKLGFVPVDFNQTPDSVGG